MSQVTKMLVARVIMTVVALFTIVAPYAADWNSTHIYNPLWPPHAKFHNAQTMAMAVLLGIAALFFTWRRQEGETSALMAAWLLTALYWVSQALAFLFPGVAWTDPNLLSASHTLDEVPMQLKGDIVLFALLGVVCWMLVTGSRKVMAR